MPERGPNPEAEKAHWEQELARRDEEIITSLGPKDIERLKGLYTENLTRKKKRIVGVRSEDLFHLMQCIKKGGMPSESLVNQAERFTKNEAAGFYLAANPESEALKRRFSKADYESASFREMTQDNIVGYGYISSAGESIRRNIIPHIDVPRMAEAYKQAMGHADASDANMLNEVLARVGMACHDQDAGYNPDETGHEAMKAIVTGGEGKIPKEVLLSYLDQLVERKGMIIAFNEKVFEGAEVFLANDDRKTERKANEVIIIPTNKTIPLEAIEGFEVLGDYEERVLERLGVVEKE